MNAPLLGDAVLPPATGRPTLTCELAITVIMPCYNAAATLAASIRCVLEQTHANTDLIVVDDGSSDDSVPVIEELVREHPGRVHLLRQDHQGPYPARNLALRAARGDCVAFLDADDTWTPDCLERLRDALLAADADLAYCGWQNVGPAAASTESYVPLAYEDGDLYAEGLRGCPWPIHAALVRREAVTAVGGFSERMFTSMDYDFWLRLLAYTRRIVRVPAVMAFYYWHGRQISTDRSRQVLDAVQVRKDFVAAHPECVAHLEPRRLRELTDGHLLKMAYRAYWSRQLATAQRLFRAAAAAGVCGWRDLPYVWLSKLPPRVFWTLIRLRDGSKSR
ncbi:MAG TPA: glycosyltransferase family A protein [Gammaproteobacteria bacterium]|nr:glycosyltransferase family A protein [Gammaproteobacteria bacterium]